MEARDGCAAVIVDGFWQAIKYAQTCLGYVWEFFARLKIRICKCDDEIFIACDDVDPVNAVEKVLRRYFK
jgi:hypothetical protein